MKCLPTSLEIYGGHKAPAVICTELPGTSTGLSTDLGAELYHRCANCKHIFKQHFLTTCALFWITDIWQAAATDSSHIIMIWGYFLKKLTFWCPKWIRTRSAWVIFKNQNVQNSPYYLFQPVCCLTSVLHCKSHKSQNPWPKWWKHMEVARLGEATIPTL